MHNPVVGTRERCILAGLDLARNGLERLTVADVARSVGIGYQAVLYHFPGGRETLRTAVVDYAVAMGDNRVIGQLRAIGELR